MTAVELTAELEEERLRAWAGAIRAAVWSDARAWREWSKPDRTKSDRAGGRSKDLPEKKR